MKNPAMAVVLDFDWGIDPAGRDEVNRRSIRLGRHDFDRLKRFQVVVQLNLEGFRSIESQKFPIFTGTELQRKDPHADEV